jgi:integrase
MSADEPSVVKEWSRAESRVGQEHRDEREPDALRASFTREEAKLLLDASAGHPLEAFFTLALACGLRRGEALGLMWSDIDLDAATLPQRDVAAKIDAVLGR